ncbi:crossover junction endodeoxyribonuclease RuvC [uncultured Victivallis sp.]|uniref:crossover junction endodeoxyribonuclease RuvC n=1 Tax=uncultured Victivallis sp. TaxID=354118 RepID=UPI0025F06AA1|nr:crossover junction endodeoxyribonuclease RuvC [uncultured Victivallis sp.]
MVILGIDPAIRTTGYGVIRAESAARFEILDCGIIANSARLPHTECLRRLAGGIRELVGAFTPDYASIEDPFVGRNASTAIILGMARGAILTALAESSVPVYSYSPSSAKRAAFGSGKATKEQVALMVSAETGIAIERIPLDSTDAIALAVCHAQKLLHSGLGVPGAGIGKAL